MSTLCMMSSERGMSTLYMLNPVWSIPYQLGSSQLDGYQIVFSSFYIIIYASTLIYLYLHFLGPDKGSVEHSSETVNAETVVPEIPDGRTDGTDTYVADSSFSVGKSPPQNGISASERASGAGGLGEGTPKVCCLSCSVSVSYMLFYIFWFAPSA